MTAKNPARTAHVARTGLLCLALWALWPTAPALAQTVYISDELTVPVRTGPSPTHRILRIIRAGTPLEVLGRDADAGFTRVSLRDGAEGWVPDQYLVSTPIARDRLEAATQEVARLRSTVAELQAQLGAVREERGEARESTETLSEEVLRLESELAEIRRMSANAIATENANRELQALNARLRSELDDLLEERDRLLDQAEQRWFLIGGGLVLLGLLLGVLLKSRPRRSAWS
ncbi:MAG: TIGR04211 family SH3 domain-containing protein [bacterium]